MAASSSQTVNEGPNLFYRCVEYIFTNWTALKYAVQMEMGGTASAAKAQWLIAVVDQYFRENADLLEYEVEDLLSDVLNTEFDMIADDGSISEISHKLCRLYRLQEQNKEEELLTFLNTTPCSKGNNTQTVSNLESNLRGLQLSSETPSQVKDTNDQEMESMETTNDPNDEWTTITRSRRK